MSDNVVHIRRVSIGAQELRQLADDIEAGLVEGFVFAAMREGGFVFANQASMMEGLALATLLQDEIIATFKEET